MVDFGLDYDFIYGFTDELSLVVKDDKYGFIDKTGKLVIGLDYDLALPFYAPILKSKTPQTPASITNPLPLLAKSPAIKYSLGRLIKKAKPSFPLSMMTCNQTPLFI